jgi:hypothetical protein
MSAGPGLGFHGPGRADKCGPGVREDAGRMSKNLTVPRGRMRLVVRADGGRIVAERSAGNIVLRQGAAIIAGLFSGAAGSQPINEVQVGFGREALDAVATALDTGGIDEARLRSPITSEHFTIKSDRPDFVEVAIASVFRPTMQLEDVTEAGLLAGGKLYNQVVFEPVTLRVGQDVTFFWNIEFNFGH